MSGYHNSFAETYDMLTTNIPYDQRGEYFHALFQTFGIPTTSSTEIDDRRPILLDLACGTGSLSEIMATLGYNVIGVDGSPEMLAQAMDKKYESGHDILYLCQDMRQLDLYGTIDGAICALDSLNHLTSIRDVQNVLARVSLFLTPGGLFLFDVNTLYKHEKILSGNTFVYDTDDVFCVWQNSPCQNGTVEITLDFFQPGEEDLYTRETEVFSETAYSHEELLNCISQAGLELLACYAGDSLEPPSPTSERMVYVTRSTKK